MQLSPFYVSLKVDFLAHGPKWVDPFGPTHGFCPGLSKTHGKRNNNQRRRELSGHVRPLNGKEK
jgi:hypothetical protein